MIRRLPDLIIEPVVRMALAEDLGRAGDLTGQACIPEGARMRAVFAARRPGVLAGVDCVRLALRAMDPAAEIETKLRDGEAFEAGTVLAEAEADARAFLAAERTALNLLGRLCGVATLTRSYVEAVAGTGARIADTRKTTPGLRALEKHAVVCGGGVNHRFGLDDAILIKDNHVALCGGDPVEAVRRARANAGHLAKIELEVDSLRQLEAVLEVAQRETRDGQASPDVVMLDNFSLADLRQAVLVTDGWLTMEASGGVTLETVRAIAETGVDIISVGALTHSAPSLDIGLDAL
jgi:nicotinate-nucleotide pyrophosphorylase (carboxylating)